MSDLTGKVALVTGGSRGIGAAVAVKLAADGVDVAITYQNAEVQAKAVVAEIESLGRRAVAIRADSADAGDVVRAVNQAADELGRLDILVNNAGIFPAKPFEEFTVEEVDRALNIHARAAFVGAQAAVAHMSDGGRIISVGSNLSEHAPFAGLSLYNLSKSALNGFTKALARELGPRGITVNLLQPGSTVTDMNPVDGGHYDTQVGLTALGRFAKPEDMAAMVAFLAGETGRSITGAIFTVDGGTNA
ncbi:NAD(P)-dependent dehydrogenase (short-subunit alcohol dehydrogenase family) [Nocardia tenerifensis]|uniref:NAD(P)-dependent dehydrogenase (Short-subunit alcohol dehydrogenase family) n=1 Tax=Nocardia tenerifensis TaxID=228006 RepID=A0A318JP36_9NOCA|nr:SDR family oxidoreductase [Nocardia tenerifensis]PXX54031.1 NAD(P)-dependent dehydrogenase (short-subunit alcohol dehydrogenase family) [Nocardia tenerifensis]